MDLGKKIRIIPYDEADIFFLSSIFFSAVDCTFGAKFNSVNMVKQKQAFVDIKRTQKMTKTHVYSCKICSYAQWLLFFSL